MEFSSVPRAARGFVTGIHAGTKKRVERTKRRSRRIVWKTRNERVPSPTWLASYPVMVIGHTIMTILVLTGRVRIIGKEKIPHHLAGLAILSNHPSFWEAYLFPFIFGWRSLRPKRFPFSTPDQGNFGSRWFFFAKPRFILVPRGVRRALAKAIAKANRLLRKGYRVIMFVEGGRTSSGSNLAFRYGRRYRMRRLGSGAGRIIYKTEVPALLVYVEDSDVVCPRGRRFPTLWNLFTRRTTITIGPTFVFKRDEMSHLGDRGQVVDWITERLTREFKALALRCKERRLEERRARWRDA